MSVSLENLDFKASSSWECARNLLVVLPLLFSFYPDPYCLICPGEISVSDTKGAIQVMVWCAMGNSAPSGKCPWEHVRGSDGQFPKSTLSELPCGLLVA